VLPEWRRCIRVGWLPVIPIGTSERDVRFYHLHIDPRFGEADFDVVLPMRRLTELVQEGIVGQPASRHYSFMGYILEPTVLRPGRRADRHPTAVRAGGCVSLDRPL
jgi:hypothetical protein